MQLAGYTLLPALVPNALSEYILLMSPSLQTVEHDEVLLPIMNCTFFLQTQGCFAKRSDWIAQKVEPIGGTWNLFVVVPRPGAPKEGFCWNCWRNRCLYLCFEKKSYAILANSGPCFRYHSVLTNTKGHAFSPLSRVVMPGKTAPSSIALWVAEFWVK